MNNRFRFSKNYLSKYKSDILKAEFIFYIFILQNAYFEQIQVFG